LIQIYKSLALVDVNFHSSWGYN